MALNRQTWEATDFLDGYRLASVKWFLLLLSALSGWLGLDYLLLRQDALGWWLLVLMGVVLLAAASVHFSRLTPFPNWLVALFAMWLLWLLVARQGIGGLFWAYPVLLGGYLILPLRQSHMLSVAVIGMVTVLAWDTFSGRIAIQVGLGLLLTSALAHFFVHSMVRTTVQLNDQATSDPLTGLYNRRQLWACGEWSVAMKQRYGTPMSLLVADADHFKRVNDLHGHGIGDHVLQELAVKIRSSVRTIDHVFRIGGEEFAVLLPEASLDKALLVAEKLRLAIETASLAAQHSVTMSVGVAELALGEDLETLLQRCDQALYQAKEAGRNRVCASGGTGA